MDGLRGEMRVRDAGRWISRTDGIARKSEKPQDSRPAALVIEGELYQW